MAGNEMYHLKFVSTRIVERLQKTFNAFKSINVLSVLQTDLYGKLQQSLSVAIDLTKCEFISKMNTENQLILFQGFQKVRLDFTHAANSKRAKMRLKLGLYEPISVMQLNECTSFHFEIISLIFSFLDNEKVLYELANFGMSTIVNTIIETLIQFQVIISISCDEETVESFQEKATKWAQNQLEKPLHDLMRMIRMSSVFNGNYLYNCEYICREAVHRINVSAYPELDVSVRLWLIELINRIKRDINQAPMWAFNEDVSELQTGIVNDNSVEELGRLLKIAVDSEKKIEPYMPRYITENDKIEFVSKFKGYIKVIKTELSKSKPKEFKKEELKHGPRITRKIEKPSELI